MEQRSVPKRLSGPPVALDGPVIQHWRSNNYWPGRPYGPPVALVIHTEAGSEVGTIATFTANSSQVSAHFGVGLDGRIDQFVALGDSAWANGIRETGNAWDAHRLPDVNPNYLSVSIETEDRGDPGQSVTNAQLSGVLGACRLAMAQYPTMAYLLSHRDISPLSRARCCGDRWWASGRFAALASTLGLQTLN